MYEKVSFFNETMADIQNHALRIHSDNIYAEVLVLPKIPQGVIQKLRGQDEVGR